MSPPTSSSPAIRWAGTATLVGLILRRDRLRLLLWVVGLSGVTIVSAWSLTTLYPDQRAIEGYGAIFADNPALVAFAGPGHGLDEPTIGAILVNETQLWIGIALALMSIFVVTRHTRAEEETGRTDLVRAGVVGRHATMAAVATVVAGAQLVITTAAFSGFVALGYPALGAAALVISLWSIGVFFTASTLAIAQLTTSSRSCLIWSSVVLAAAFVLRAIGDIGRSPLSWTSPIGWAQAVRAFDDEQWWTPAFAVSVALVIGGTAAMVSLHRDIGSAFAIATRRRAHRRLRRLTPLGLAILLQRASVIGWIVALASTAIVVGTVVDEIDAMVAANPQITEFMADYDGASLRDMFFATSMSFLGVFTGGFAVSSSLASHLEETAGRAELMLAGPLDRIRWFASHFAVAVGGSILIVMTTGLALAVSYAVTVGDPGQILRLGAAAAVTIPAVLVVVGYTTALVGVMARRSTSAWAVLGALGVIAILGEVLRLPAWIRGISPFHHLPAVPAERFAVQPLLALIGIAGLSSALGFVAFAHRDLNRH